MAKKIMRKEEIVRATRKFTDREQPRKVFFDKYDALKQQLPDVDDIYVITYYGVGGIGKSTLLRKLQEELKEKEKNPYYLHYDFETSQDMKTSLQFMKTKLEKDYKFSFPLFDLALYAYSNKIGDTVEKKEVQSYVEQSRTLSFIMDSIEDIPLIGMASKLVKLADSGIAVLKNLTSNYKKELSQIEQDSAKDIYQDLPYYFSLDLEENVKKLNQPLVIFLDTYEKLVNEVQDTGYSISKDLWLRGDRGPILNVPGILWVIAGREKIKWGESDTDWEDTLDQHILGDLSWKDASSFLSEAGISDETLRKEIYELTHGTPIYLDICVSTYEILSSQGRSITIDEFGKNPDALIERYIRYMDHQSSEMVYLLSQIPLWNDDMIHEVGPKILPDFSYVLYEKIKKLSFVCNLETWSYIHKTVNDVFNANCPEVIRKKSVDILYHYYYDFLVNHSTVHPNYSYYLDGFLQVSLDYITMENAEKVLNHWKKIHDILDHACLYEKDYTLIQTIYDQWAESFGNVENGYLLKFMHAHILRDRNQKLEQLEEVWEMIKDKEMSDVILDVIQSLRNLYHQVHVNPMIAREIIDRLETSNLDSETKYYWLGFYYYLIHDLDRCSECFQIILYDKDITIIKKLQILGSISMMIPLSELRGIQGKILEFAITYSEEIQSQRTKLSLPTRFQFDLNMASLFRHNSSTIHLALDYINDAEKIYEEISDSSLYHITMIILKIEILKEIEPEKVKAYAEEKLQAIIKEEMPEQLDDQLFVLKLYHASEMTKEEISYVEELAKKYQHDLASFYQIVKIATDDELFDISNPLTTELLEKVKKEGKDGFKIYEDIVLNLVPIAYQETYRDEIIDTFYQTYKKEYFNHPNILAPVLYRLMDIYAQEPLKKEIYMKELIQLYHRNHRPMECAEASILYAKFIGGADLEKAIELTTASIEIYDTVDGYDRQKQEAMVLLGELYLKKGEVEKAIHVLDKVISNSDYPEFGVQAFRLKAKYTKPSAETIQLLQTMYEQHQKAFGKGNEESLEDLYLLAKHTYLLDQKDKAMNLFQDLLEDASYIDGKASEKYLTYFIKLVDFLSEQKDYKRQCPLSKELCFILLEHVPNSVTTIIDQLTQYGEALAHLNEKEKAYHIIDILKQYLSVQPSKTEAIILGMISIADGMEDYANCLDYSKELCNYYRDSKAPESDFYEGLDRASIFQHLLGKYDSHLYDIDKILYEYYVKQMDFESAQNVMIRLERDKKYLKEENKG